MLRSRASRSQRSPPLQRRSYRGVPRSMDSFSRLFLQGRGGCRHRWRGGGERRPRQLGGTRCRSWLPCQLTASTANGGLTRSRRRRAAELQCQPLWQRRPMRSVTMRPVATSGRRGRRLGSRVLRGTGRCPRHAERVPRRRLPRPRRRLGGPLRPPRPPRPIRSGLPVRRSVGALAFIAKAGLSNAMIPYFRFSEVAEEFLRDGPFAPQAR